MDKTRVYPPEKIQPSSIEGDVVKVYSRNFYFPFKRIQSNECDTILYTSKAKDNSSATVQKETKTDCLRTEFTNIAKNSKISGTEIYIQTKIKVRDKNVKKVNLTGKHKAQELDLTEFTHVELLKEESNIIRSSDYPLLLEKKEKLELNSNGMLEIEK